MPSNVFPVEVYIYFFLVEILVEGLPKGPLVTVTSGLIPT